jgi:hypothetical protein
MSEGRRVFVELACTVVIPAAVMIFGSSPDRLGPLGALGVGLAFPLGYAFASMIREGRPSALSIVALGSVLLSGVIGLFELDPAWFATKEALLPTLLGAMVCATTPTRYALVPVLLERLLDADRTRAALSDRGTLPEFERVSRRGTLELGGVTILSGLGSYLVARGMVTSPTGTAAFADELGRYTVASFVVVGLPAMAASVWVLRRVLDRLEAATGVPLEDLTRG